MATTLLSANRSELFFLVVDLSALVSFAPVPLLNRLMPSLWLYLVATVSTHQKILSRQAQNTAHWNPLPALLSENAGHEELLARNIFIYVHGSDTSEDNAIDQGRKLSLELKKAAVTTSNRNMLVTSPVSIASFYTFLWRGNYGTLGFATAEKAADNSSVAFADFLRLVHEATTPPRNSSIIIIAHSLGGRVVLKALNELAAEVAAEGHRRWVNCLLMVQPVVTLKSVVQGAYTEYIGYNGKKEHHIPFYPNQEKFGDWVIGRSESAEPQPARKTAYKTPEPILPIGRRPPDWPQDSYRTRAPLRRSLESRRGNRRPCASRLLPHPAPPAAKLTSYHRRQLETQAGNLLA